MTPTTASTSSTTPSIYPTEKPDTGNVHFTMILIIYGETRASVILQLSKVVAAFQRFPEFLEAVIVEMFAAPIGDGTSLGLNTPVSVAVRFRASSVHNRNVKELSSFKNSLKGALDNLNNTLDKSRYSFEPESVDLDSFVTKLTDVCNAEGTGREVCGNRYTCQNSTCFFKCEFHPCSGHGKCYLEQVNDNFAPKCKCSSDDVYTFSGENCQERQLQDKWVSAIAGGAIGILLLLLAALAALYICCRRRKLRFEMTTYSDGEPSDIGSTYRRSVIAPRFRPEYGTMSGTSLSSQFWTGDMYLPRGSTGSYESPLVHGGGGAPDIPSPAKPFAIKRPKFSPVPLNFD